MKEQNVDAINIVPGEDVVYFDCRVLPRYDVANVIAEVERILQEFAAKTGAKITFEIVQKQPAPNFPQSDAEIVELLKEALYMQLRPVLGRRGEGRGTLETSTGGRSKDPVLPFQPGLHVFGRASLFDVPRLLERASPGRVLCTHPGRHHGPQDTFGLAL
jgi:acetylornithine deacetylase/succinyl-diaminopimelate desuccinylase-like protein